MNNQYDSKIEKLINQMTIKEKIGQLNQPETPLCSDLEKFKEKVRNGEVGSILMSIGATAGNDEQGAIDVNFYNELQRIAVEESKNGIPILFGRDVIHGHRTVFPIPLAMSASFNPELIEKSYECIAKEASNESVHWTFTPMLDLSRDPRWGRIIESTGEDPYVGAKVAEAVVKGLQGDDVGEKTRLISCAKHYIGYGASEGGRDYHRTEISDYSLFNYYLPAFRAAIKAGVKTVMSSFNDVNGQPITSSKYYLTDILRKTLSFDGFVVSDYDAVIQLKRQGVAETSSDCCSMAISAGLDMDMHDNCYIDNLEVLIENGIVDIQVLDEAVRRVLKVKFAKGLFEDPYCHPTKIERSKHLETAYSMAAESMVLLKNENNILPLNTNNKIALIGPFANEKRTLLGSWTIDGKAEETKSLFETMNSIAGLELKTTSFAGVDLDRTSEVIDWSDVIILALGESWTATGESRAVSNITISDDQISLIKKAKSTGKKVIGVFFCGRPIAMQGIAEHLDAILYAWHSGSETARAVCDILLGKIAPSGKLPVTFPRLATHIPLYYNVTSSGRPVNCYYGENAGACYVDSIATPYYPFGYGLSYTEFSYSQISCEKSNISMTSLKQGDCFNISIRIKNIGNCDAKETVQLYIHDKVSSIMRPIRELKAFNKKLIPANKEITFDFTLTYNDLGYYLPNGDYIVEKGEFDIFIGKDCFANDKITVCVD